jgi:ferric-dicitrate binding protein FerR (iron transport regulator)
MNERERREGRESARRFREALYAEVEQGPARLEFERRRLLARLPVGPGARRNGAGARVAAFGLTAALAAAAAVLLTLWPGEPAPVVESIRLDGPWRVLPGDAFSRGALVRVPPGRGARLELGGGTVLWLGPGSEVRALDREAAVLRLAAGRLVASVRPRPPGSELRVFAGALEIVVRGTVFSAAAEAGRSRVRLHSGRVELRGLDRTIDVQPGFEVELGGDGTASLGPIDAAGALSDLLVAGRAAHAAGGPLPEIALPPPAAEPREPEPVPAPGPERPAPRRSPAVREVPPILPEPRPAEARPPEPALADPALAAIEVEAAPAADELYLRALEQAREGDLEGSRRALLDYLARFPEGRYWDRVRDILGE